MTRPLLLDLFCCQGGAATGYHQAGFDIVGIDIEPQPLYPFPFIQGDALNPPVNLTRFDAIHASPPCQAYSVATANPDNHPRLLEPIRQMLRQWGGPYIIENVEGASRELNNPFRLCGSFFDLKVRRHRLFESNIAVMSTPCNHSDQGRTIGVYGHSDGPNATRGSRHGDKARTIDEARDAMGMPWADWHGCKEAIPPAYTEHIGQQLIGQL